MLSACLRHLEAGDQSSLSCRSPTPPHVSDDGVCISSASWRAGAGFWMMQQHSSCLCVFPRLVLFHSASIHSVPPLHALLVAVYRFIDRHERRKRSAFEPYSPPSCHPRVFRQNTSSYLYLQCYLFILPFEIKLSLQLSSTGCPFPRNAFQRMFVPRCVSLWKDVGRQCFTESNQGFSTSIKRMIRVTHLLVAIFASYEYRSIRYDVCLS